MTLHHCIMIKLLNFTFLKLLMIRFDIGYNVVVSYDKELLSNSVLGDCPLVFIAQCHIISYDIMRLCLTQLAHQSTHMA